MATTVTKVVDPDMGSGYDYDSLFDWEAAQQGNLTGARDEIAVAKCRCTGGTADTTTVVIAGWTPGATQYVKIWTDPSEAYRHNGTWQTGNKYRLIVSAGTNSGALEVATPYTRIIGLQVQNNEGGGWSSLYQRESENVIIDSCLMFGGYNGFSAESIGGSLFLINCIAISNSAAGFSLACGSAFPGTAYLYNCVSANNGGGGFVLESWSTDEIIIAKNCYSGGNAGADYDNAASGTFTLTTCRSEDGSLSTTTAAFSTSSGCYFTNVTAGSEDCHIGASSALIGAATNLYNDANYPFQTDIDGQDRGGAAASWDIGADEYVAAGGTTLTINVTDSVTGAEVTTGVGGTLVASTSDTFSVSESTTGVTGSLVCSTSDSLSISEVTTGLTGSLVGTTSDSVSISELTTAVTGSIILTVTDSLTVSDLDLVSCKVGSPVVSVTESVTTSGVVTIQLSLGSIVWGQSAGVSELVKRTFGNWTGTGSSGGSGDEEILEIHTGEYMQSAEYELGLGSYAITANKYRAGGTPIIKYKTASTSAGIAGASLLTFSGSFSSLGWIQVRLEASGDTIIEDVEVNLITLAPSVSDIVGVSGEVSCTVAAAAEGPTLGIDSSDSIEVLEVVSTLIPWYNISVDDTLQAEDESVLSMIREVSIFDTLLVEEEVVISCPLTGVGVSETVLVQELVGCGLGDLELSVEESSSLSESTISVASAPVINVSESVLVQEEVTVVRIVSGEFNVQDSVSVEDSIGIQVSDLPSSSFDTVTLDEQASVEIRLQVEAVEVITVSSAVQIATSALEISVNESILVGEVVSGVTGELVISITDSVGVGEVVSTGSTLADLEVTADSSTGVDDSSDVEFVFAISVTEQVVISESVGCLTGDLSLSVIDQVTIDESVNIYWSIASGLLILDCDILVPLLDCELLYPEVNIYMQLPTIDLEVS
jgi:hypothetical protein